MLWRGQNDGCRELHAGEIRRYVYAIEAWTDEFATWRRDFIAKRGGWEESGEF